MSSSLHTLLFCFLHFIHQSRTLNEAEWGPIQIYSKYHKSIWQKALSFKTIFQNLLAAVFKQNWWDQLFEYEHVLQLVRMCVRVNRLHSPHVVSLPSFCIKTIPPTGSDRPVMFCCFCFEEQCDVLCDQLIWMCTYLHHHVVMLYQRHTLSLLSWGALSYTCPVPLSVSL